MYRIRIKWGHDEVSTFIDPDTCYVFEPSKKLYSNFCHQLDIPGTYDKLINVGGCTPEQAHRQTSYAWNRLRQWHNDQWNYVGCIAYVDRLVDEDWSEVGNASVWGINNDCGDYRLETETTQIHEVLRQLQSAGTITSFMQSARLDQQGTCLDGVPVEVIEDEESIYMTDEPAELSDSDLLPPWNQFFELRAYGDTRLQYHCTSCGEVFPADTFTESEVRAGYCKETTCARYPHKYAILYQGDSVSTVLAHPTGRVQEEWDRVLTRLDRRVEANCVPSNVPLLTWYAYHTGCDILAEVPEVTTKYAWSNNEYIDKAPSFAWIVGKGELIA